MRDLFSKIKFVKYEILICGINDFFLFAPWQARPIHRMCCLFQVGGDQCPMAWTGTQRWRNPAPE